jgi:hypothetical protein
LQTAAAEMAVLVWGPCNLIPAPDHTGDTSANRRLAKAIAAHVKGGAEVHDILTRTAPAPSTCDRHRNRGPAVSVAEHNITRRAHGGAAFQPVAHRDSISRRIPWYREPLSLHDVACGGDPLVTSVN